MLNKKNVLYDIYIYFLFVLFCLRFSDIGIFNIINGVGSIIFLLTSVIFMIWNLDKLRNTSKVKLIILWGLVLFSLLGSFRTTFGMGGFILLVAYGALLIEFEFIKIRKKVIDNVIILMTIFWVLYFFTSKTGYNPNTLGQVTYVLMIYAVMFLSSKRFKIVTIPVVIILSYTTIIASKSRGSLLAFILFVVLYYLVPKKLLKSKFIYYGLCIGLTIGSIVFAIIYVHLWKAGIAFKTLDSTKSLYSGRQSIWYELFGMIKTHPFWGVGSHYKLTAFSSFNCHNSMLNIVSVYGIPIFIYYLYLFFNIFSKIRKNVADSKIVKIAMAGFFGFLFLAFFETNLLWEPVAFQGLFWLLIGRLYAKEERIEKEQKEIEKRQGEQL